MTDPNNGASSLPSTSTPSDVLGEKTRTQFKTDSYATFVSPSVASILTGEGEECATPCVNKETCNMATSKRGVVDFSEVAAVVEKLCCPQCQHTTLTFRTDIKKSKGLAVYADVFCATCEEAVSGTEGFLAAKSDGNKDFINRQAVFSALICGLGSTAFNNFCESMDLQGMHHKTFHSKANKLYAKTSDLETRVFSETVTYVRQVHAHQAGITFSDDDVLDISVSFDGTWLTRGHSSHIGVGCVVDLLTGLCLDVHVMCTYCQACESTGKKLYNQLKDNPEECGMGRETYARL